ncbi:STE12 transcription factor [Tubulinosema ratisbonensis]|uniref:STE12 transcription factor n=1 Tax=Tubulinosema ratisbonensis TaxID=291195 RepID=A0A437AN78_9MICR|nr:STE12 transcription factor [Tubulinosema ratisbonensis]
MNIQGDTDLFHFLTNAPKEFRENEKIRKYQLKNGDYIHCVLWNNHFYITGTDVVKILVWRFQNSGRNLVSMKKFEEGVFSDLRNLKPGVDATLENPRSEFLEFLYKNGCIRTQKKQKVFYWYSVPHDSLFCDALERDLRRENTLNNYGKFINIEEHNFIPEDYKYSLNRKLFKRQNSPYRNINLNPMKPAPVNNSYYPPNYGYSENNMVKNFLFNTTTQSPQYPVSNPELKMDLGYNAQPMPKQESIPQNITQKFTTPFSFDEIDYQSSYFGNNELFAINEEYDKQKYPKEVKSKDDERIGTSKDTYTMPNAQSGFQK